MKILEILAPTCFCFVLSACVYVPVVNDSEAESATCKTFTKSMSFDAIEMQGNMSVRCQNEGCVALLASSAVISAGSIIISGSIVLTGNTIHWLEYQGKCSDGYLNKTKQLFLDSINGHRPSN